VISIYGALLWLDRVRDVPWLYVIWSLASLFNHMVCRVFLKSSHVMAHISLLGYSVTPIIPLATLVVVLRPPIWICTVLVLLAVAWSSLAAITSYFIVFKTVADAEERRKLMLVLPSVVLMELYLISLLPLRPLR
jgi:hypothetical protein